MQTLSYRPRRQPLAHFVDVIWLSRAGRFDYRNVTLPLLRHELMINFSDRFEVSAGEENLIANAPAWVAGLQTRPIQTETEGRHFTVGVLFKPLGLYALTGVDAEIIRDRCVELRDLFGEEALHLAEALYQAPTAEAAFQCMEDFLLRHLLRRSLPAYLPDALARLQLTPLPVPVVENLAQQYGIAQKTLIQHFKKYVGATPARYHHLAVFNRLLDHLARHPEQPLTQTGYDLDFFDQAHFIHFFRRYTGLTPSAYLRAFREGRVQSVNPHSLDLRAR